MRGEWNERIAEAFASLMVEKIGSLAQDWRQPWVSLPLAAPRNVRGNEYRGCNAFLLGLLTDVRHYAAPVFMTFMQAREAGLCVRRGARSFPVVFFGMYAKAGGGGGSVSMEEYGAMGEEERAGYTVVRHTRCYNVFNIDQTDMRERDPKGYDEAVGGGACDGAGGAYCCEPIDRLRERWVCPVHVKPSNAAYYSVSGDYIVCPEKRQFGDGAEFYATLTHEMAHSTGIASRLGRYVAGDGGRESYAREELVAELSAAMCGAHFGFAAMPQDNNAAYLKYWLECLGREPAFLMDVLADAQRAVRMIVEMASAS